MISYEDGQRVETVDFDYDAGDQNEEVGVEQAQNPFAMLRCMAVLCEWASGSKARMLAVQIVLMQDRRPVRQAALAAKLDRTHVYKCIRDVRRLIAETTA